ncbi:hypothetical protein IFM89_025378 [Coptis chinensis]|uniref:PARG helical domain-containing protein n=1 Tax=Coptis chinensis TaxID=261450 RepID=A0A835IPC1_9MAGN|nr:hypothetical protein IFM89_025378 [Coptis chinensis]
MENRKDLKSILPFLPLVLRSSSLFWPSQVVKALKSLAKGPTHCNVDSGEIFFLAVEDIRNSLGLSSHSLASNAGQGYSLFFDELMTSVESNKWFDEVVPGLASLLLRLPDLLEGHYAKVDEIGNGGVEGFCGVELGLRQLDSQQAGIVFLSQVVTRLKMSPMYMLCHISNDAIVDDGVFDMSPSTSVFVPPSSAPAAATSSSSTPSHDSQTHMNSSILDSPPK